MQNTEETKGWFAREASPQEGMDHSHYYVSRLSFEILLGKDNEDTHRYRYRDATTILTSTPTR